MLERIFITYSAPTLAGLKVANLFCLREESIASLDSLQETLRERGIEIRILKQCRGTLVYVYRRSWLQTILSIEENRSFLESYGHPTNSVDALLTSFCDKVKGPSFPHEIGLLLGYPLDDVKGFIAHNGTNDKCVGYWKVYGDAQSATENFARFRQCTDTFLKRYEMGSPLSNLAVAF